MSFKRKLCQHCKGKLAEGEYIHEGCIEGFAAARQLKADRKVAKQEKMRQKADRAETARRKEAIKPLSKWRDECQAIANKIARLRDFDDGCISCDKPANWQGQWHGSHFRSVGAASAVRFNLWNIHKACSICNHHNSGNLAGYTPRLIAKIGQERVDWLNAQTKVTRYDVDYLKKYKRIMGKKLRRLEKRLEWRKYLFTS